MFDALEVMARACDLRLHGTTLHIPGNTLFLLESPLLMLGTYQPADLSSGLSQVHLPHDGRYRGHDFRTGHVNLRLQELSGKQVAGMPLIYVGDSQRISLGAPHAEVVKESVLVALLDNGAIVGSYHKAGSELVMGTSWSDRVGMGAFPLPRTKRDLMRPYEELFAHSGISPSASSLSALYDLTYLAVHAKLGDL